MLKRQIEYLRSACSKSRSAPVWLAAFVIGFILPFALFDVGHLFKITYDSLVLPILYQIILPCLPFMFVVVILLSMFRPERDGAYRNIIMLLLGVILGLSVVNDWWYFIPIYFAIFISFMVWRLRWHLWSQCQFTVVMILTLILIILGNTVLNFQGLLPFWDNRFSLGLSSVPNFVFLIIFLAAIGLMLFLWAWRYWFNGDKLNRALLTDIIEREPRCSKYFDAVGKLTSCSIKIDKIQKMRKGDRLPVSSNRLDELPEPIFPGTVSLPKRIETYWKWGYIASSSKELVNLFRMVRSTVMEIRLPSNIFLELLEEATRCEYNEFLRETFESFSTNNQQVYARRNHISENELLSKKKAKGRFARYTLLKEALIEAKCYFFLSASCITPQQSHNYVPRLVAKLQEIKTSHWQNNVENSSVNDESITPNWQSDLWQKASGEYLYLWQQNIDRLVIEFCDQCLNLSITNTDPIDFIQLTCNLLTCRQQSYNSDITIHNCAADLALWLFLVSDEYDNKIKDTLTNYFREQRSLLDKGRTQMSPKDWSELGLACVAYSLWMGSKDNWVDAGFAFTLFPEITDNNHQNDIVLRNLAHVKAAYALQELNNGRSHFGVKDLVVDALSEYLNLDNQILNRNASGDRCSGNFFASCFHSHVPKELLIEEKNR